MNTTTTRRRRTKATRTEGVVCYRRVSTGAQAATGYGLDDQRSTLEAWCSVAGLPIVADLADEGISGTSTKNRVALAQALELLANGEASVLLVKSTSRLGRKTTDVLRIADLAIAQGWRLVVTDLGLDTGSATGRLTLSLLAAVAQHEAERIGQLTKDGLAAAAAKGVVLGRPAAKLEAATARIVELRATGATWRSIADTMNAEAFTTATGKTWLPMSCQRAFERA